MSNEAEDRARVAIDANGHLAMQRFDAVAGRRDGTPWSWCCSCGAYGEYFANRADAIADGGEHIAQHGGRWDDEQAPMRGLAVDEQQFEAYREEQRRKREMSREGAIENVEVLNLEQPLLRFLEDDELERMAELTIDMQRTLHREGFEAGQVFVMATLRVVLENEKTTRKELAEQARIALESNGHEACLAFDRGAARQDGRGWWVVCSCEHGGDYRATRDEAVVDGEAHFREHGGGRWRHDLSD